MKKATYGQRFAAALIDVIIFAVFAILVSLILNGIFGVAEPQALTELMDQLFNTDISYEDWYAQYEQLITNNTEVANYMSAQSKVETISLIINLIGFVGYFIILPIFWKNNQTVGRFVMKIKVVDEGADYLSVSAIIIRELVGTLLITVILSCCCCIPLIINLIIMARGRSIQDSISRTEVVSSIHKLEENNGNELNSFLNAEVTSSKEVEEEKPFNF